MNKTRTNNRKRTRPVEKTFYRAFENYRPPADLTVSEWAAEYRILSRENSAEAGPWRNERTPYLVGVMDAFNDPKVSHITFVSSSQVGKSEAELNIIGYIIDQDPGSILYIQPTLDDAKKFSRLRIAPMIRDSKTLSSKVADIKSRDSGNTMLQKSFAGGMITIVGSNSASGLASTPAKYVIGDELDRWALSAGTEGDPWKLAEARTTTFYNSKMVAVSTPTIKDASKIETLYSEGTQERWCVQCPDCGEWHDIVFDDIKFTFDTIKKGRKKDYIVKSVDWCCPSCGCLSSEEVIKKQPAKWIAKYPDAYKKGNRSFWLNAFASPWQPWENIIYSFLTSRSDPQALKVVYNTMLGELWEDRGDLVDEDTIMSRREDYGTREDGSPVELPDGVLVLTCGVDTQDNRLEFEILGHSHYGETYGIKKGILMGDPHYPEVWERLDDVIDHVYRFKDPARGLKVSITFVDSGGHKTQDVYRECAKRLNKRAFAIKGQGGDGVPYTKPPSKVNIVADGKKIGKAWLYVIGVDAGKADIMSNLNVQEPGAKYCHFPRDERCGYDATFFSGLLSEKLVMKTERGRTRWVWEKIPGHERNEALDCRNYALAAFRAIDPNLDAIERRMKQSILEGQYTGQANQKPQKQKSRVRRNKLLDGAEW